MKKLLLLSMTLAFSTASMANLIECNLTSMEATTGKDRAVTSQILNTDVELINGINIVTLEAKNSEAGVKAVIQTEVGVDTANVQLISGSADNKDNSRKNLSGIGTNIATTWDDNGKSYTIICKDLE